VGTLKGYKKKLLVILKNTCIFINNTWEGLENTLKRVLKKGVYNIYYDDGSQ
jgi:hypothetical protein